MQTDPVEEVTDTGVVIVSRRVALGALAGLFIVAGLSAQVAASDAAQDARVARGRYLVTIGGCNDCHTPRFPETAGRIPEADRLTGSGIGFQGPWGTTYPVNLRVMLHSISEGEWLAKSQAAMRPPVVSRRSIST